MTPSMLKVLAMIAKRPMSGVEAHAEYGSENAKAILTNLFRAGMVVRSRGTSDGKGCMTTTFDYQVSPKGQAVLREGYKKPPKIVWQSTNPFEWRTFRSPYMSGWSA